MFAMIGDIVVHKDDPEKMLVVTHVMYDSVGTGPIGASNLTFSKYDVKVVPQNKVALYVAGRWKPSTYYVVSAPEKESAMVLATNERYAIHKFVGGKGVKFVNKAWVRNPIYRSFENVMYEVTKLW